MTKKAVFLLSIVAILYFSFYSDYEWMYLICSLSNDIIIENALIVWIMNYCNINYNSTDHDTIFIPQTALEWDLYNLQKYNKYPMFDDNKYPIDIDSVPSYFMSYKIIEIEASELNTKTFYDSFVVKSQPLLIRNIDKYLKMDAFKLWRMDSYFKNKMGNNKMKIASNILQSNTFAPYDRNIKQLNNMTMNDFLNEYNATNRTRNYYIAQTVIPKILLNDIKNKINDATIPPFAEFMEEKLKAIYLWFGNNAIINSTAHSDDYENLLIVYTGTKIIKLIHAKKRKYVYPIYHYSAVDFFNPNLKRFPLFKYCDPLTVTLIPGDMLYIPSYWFHHVLSYNRTIATSIWFHP